MQAAALAVEALLSAAHDGGIDGVRDVLSESGVDVNATAEGGFTAIFVASSAGHAALVRMLLDAGAGVDLATDEGTTPLCTASQQGYLDIVTALIKSVQICTIEEKEKKARSDSRCSWYTSATSATSASCVH